MKTHKPHFPAEKLLKKKKEKLAHVSTRFVRSNLPWFLLSFHGYADAISIHQAL